MATEFRVIEQNLSDNSKAYDVFAEEDSVGFVAWAAPSQNAAEACVETLNEVLEGFQLCGSDRQILKLRESLKVALNQVLD